MPQFLSLGNCTLDDVVTPDGRIATGQIGGNGVYAAAGMRLWGVDVALVSVTGMDFPDLWLEQLATAGIDVSAVKRLDIPHQLRSRAFYLPDGRRTDRVAEAQPFLPANAADLMDLTSEYTDTGSPLHRRIWPIFTPLPDQLERFTTDAEYAHLAPGDLRNNRANATFLKQSSRGRLVTSLDWPWWDWDQEGQSDLSLLQNIDYLLPSLEELTIHALAQRRQPFDVASDLVRLGPHAIIVKQGAQGIRLLQQSQARWHQLPVYPTQVVDPTGAGDAFCGGFLVGLAKTGDPIQAAMYGIVSASFIIEDFGVLHTLRISPDAPQTRLQHLKTLIN